MPRLRHLVVVLGDQLDKRSAAFDGFDPDRDAVWMAESEEEATHVRCHKLRLAFFFSAMRHFRDSVKSAPIIYHELREEGLGEILAEDVRKRKPEKVIVLEPGDHRVKTMLEDAVSPAFRADDHFYTDDFEEWAAGRKELRLEDFYRRARKKHGVLFDGAPEGGSWNFDKENRESFGKDGPPEVKAPRSFRPDATTKEVCRMVEERFGDHPGTLEHFDLPVTRKQALAALRDFVEHRLPLFGRYQDAMWEGRPILFHARISAALNVHLLNPRECVGKAVEAYRAGDAPIASVEGFVRQILGWREFVRGVYRHEMPSYAERNALRCPDDLDVPSFYWDGDTDMACVRDAMRSVLRHGYAHHIQRLMVLGLFAQLLGVHPLRFHEWHMAMYCDAIDWVSLPNTLGMSQYGDGGIVGSKPYCASGKYIDRMGNHCKTCRYDPGKATGDEACPFTTLYWDFLDRHGKSFSGNARMGFQMRNLERRDDLPAIRTQARKWKDALRPPYQSSP